MSPLFNRYLVLAVFGLTLAMAAIYAQVEKDTQGRTVNRCEGIAWNGGCTDTNEFNYLVVKSMRSLGVCFLENQARV